MNIDIYHIIPFLIYINSPILYLHPLEEYYPSSIEWFLENSEIHDPNISNPTLENSSSSSVLQLLEENYLDSYKGNIESLKIYVHFSSFSEYYTVQYWYFFPYNGPMMGMGEHEGDWEHISVNINRNNFKVDSIFYSSHVTEGKWYPPDKLAFESGHPVVYLSINSHASYPYPKRYERSTKPKFIPFPDDYTRKGGIRISSTDKLLLVHNSANEFNSFNCPDWLLFPGNWGKRKTDF